MTSALADPIQILLVIMVIILFSPLVKRLGLPPLFGLLIAGMIIGPNQLGFFTINDEIMLLQTIGILFIMFNAGLELDLEQFQQIKKRAILFGLISAFVPFVIPLKIKSDLDLHSRENVRISKLILPYGLMN